MAIVWHVRVLFIEVDKKGSVMETRKKKPPTKARYWKCKPTQIGRRNLEFCQSITWN